MAASISALAKPMLSMLLMAASRSLPMVSAEGSLNCWLDEAAGAGEGVPGTLSLVEEAAGAGAAGAEGV